MKYLIPLALISTALAASATEIFLQDCPPGVKATIEAKLQGGNPRAMWERFWRKYTSHRGEAHSGLGLSIVRACVTLLGGAIRPTLREDSTFEVEIRWT